MSRRFGTIHGSVQYLNYGTFIEADENGNETGTFGASDIAVSLGYAFNLPWTNVFMGFNMKMINPELAILLQLELQLILGFYTTVLINHILLLLWLEMQELKSNPLMELQSHSL